MNARARPTEEELHAYLDGELEEDRRPMVESYLRDHPKEAQRLRAYRADGEAIARIFSRTGKIAVPRPDSIAVPRSDSAVPRPDSHVSRWHRQWVRAAAMALIVAGTVVAGMAWPWRHQAGEVPWSRFGAEALAAHMSLSDANSPPAVAASLPEIAQFFSAALKRRVRMREPADADYRLVGSRFATGPNGRVVQLAFLGTESTLVTMYFQPWPGRKDAPFRPVASQSNLITVAWIDEELGCAATATLTADELERVARALYEALLDS